MNMISSARMELVGMRVLVSGGGGFIGSHLVRRLVREDMEVVVLGRSIRRLKEVERPWKFTFLDVDLSDVEAIAEVMDSFRPQVVVHLASTPDARENYKQIKESIEGNLMPTINMLEAYRNCQNGLFIYGDSTKVYGDSEVPYRQTSAREPISSYAIAKSAGWEFCRYYSRLYGMSTVSLRPTLIYGPGQAYNLINHVIDSVATGKEMIRLEGGHQTRDPLYIDDAIDAIVAILRAGKLLSGQVINIGGGREISVVELVRLVERLMDGHVPVVTDASQMRPTDTQRSYCDNEESGHLLGWAPRVDLETGLMRTIEARNAQTTPRQIAIPG